MYLFSSKNIVNQNLTLFDRFACSVQSALDSNFQDEFLTDFKCESCESVQEVVIRRKLSKLPRILILYLKRYQFVEVSSTTTSTTTVDQYNTNNNDPEIEPPPPPAQQQKVHRLIKNDSDVEINRELSMQSHILREDPPNDGGAEKNVKVERPKRLGPVELDMLKRKTSENDEQLRPNKTVMQPRKRPLVDSSANNSSASGSKRVPLGEYRENNLNNSNQLISLLNDVGNEEELVDLSSNQFVEKKVSPYQSLCEIFVKFKIIF